MTVADEFTEHFRAEHRAVRDTLLDLIRAFEARDRARIGTLLERTAELTGPHFRYEEEALYPGLVEVFGESYIEKLFGDHDRAIGAAQRLVEIGQRDSVSDTDVETAVGLIRGLLPHVSDCDGLAIMTEVIPAEKVQATLDARDRANSAGLDLIRWAQEVRGRPAVAP